MIIIRDEPSRQVPLSRGLVRLLLYHFLHSFDYFCAYKRVFSSPSPSPFFSYYTNSSFSTSQLALFVHIIENKLKNLLNKTSITELEELKKIDTKSFSDFAISIVNRESLRIGMVPGRISITKTLKLKLFSSISTSGTTTGGYLAILVYTRFTPHPLHTKFSSVGKDNFRQRCQSLVALGGVFLVDQLTNSLALPPLVDSEQEKEQGQNTVNFTLTKFQ